MHVRSSPGDRNTWILACDRRSTHRMHTPKCGVETCTVAPGNGVLMSGVCRNSFGTAAGRSRVCQAVKPAGVWQGHSSLLRNPLRSPAAKDEVFVVCFLWSPNRQHQHTVGLQEVTQTKNQITQLAFQMCEKQFSHLPPGGFPGRENKKKISTTVIPETLPGLLETCHLSQGLSQPSAGLSQDSPETSRDSSQCPQATVPRIPTGLSHHGFFPQEQHLGESRVFQYFLQ